MSLIIVVGAVMLVGVFEMLVRYQHRVSEIDRAVTGEGVSPRPSPH